MKRKVKTVEQLNKEARERAANKKPKKLSQKQKTRLLIFNKQLVKRLDKLLPNYLEQLKELNIDINSNEAVNVFKTHNKKWIEFINYHFKRLRLDGTVEHAKKKMLFTILTQDYIKKQNDVKK